MYRRWDQPVMLACKHSGQFFVITSTAEAYDFLSSKWPVSSGAAFLAALEICNGVSEGSADRHAARLAFIEAALEAGIPVTSMDAPQLPADMPQNALQ